MKRSPILWLAAAACLATAWAAAPQRWTLRTYDDWLRGKSVGVSLSAEGVLSLAPREEAIEGPTDEFYLSYLATPDGSQYVGTGHGGRVFRRGKDGRSELYFQAPEMDVTALAVDAKGVLFAATSPQGKVYRIAEKGKGTEFFNPAEKYIWDLEFEGTGNLLAAVGEIGGIYEILPDGQGRMVFKAAENHILCLLRDRNGDLIAGSGGPGVVYRIARTGRGQAVYETPFEEVRALAVDGQGFILAGASGTAKPRKDEPSAAVPVGQAEVSVSVSAASAAAAAPVTPALAGEAPASIRASLRRGSQGAGSRVPDRPGRIGPQDLELGRRNGLCPPLERGRPAAVHRHGPEGAALRAGPGGKALARPAEGLRADLRPGPGGGQAPRRGRQSARHHGPLGRAACGRRVPGTGHGRPPALGLGTRAVGSGRPRGRIRPGPDPERQHG